MAACGQTERTRETRCEWVDNWHRGWPGVLATMGVNGHRDALRIDADGWLSARRGVFAAFDGDRVEGYLCFDVRCAEEGGQPTMRDGRAAMQAVVGCVWIDPQSPDGAATERALRGAAAAYAKGVCDELVGFGEAVGRSS